MSGRYRYSTYFMIRVLKNEVGGEELKDFMKWLEKSERNRERFEKIRKLWDLLGSVGVLKVDHEKNYVMVRSKIRMEKAKGVLVARYLMSFIKRRFYVLGALLLLFGCLYAFFKFYGSFNLQNQNYVEFKVGRGEISKVILPDSTIVVLNSSSRIVYLSQQISRVVYLDGEAYFIVRSNRDAHTDDYLATFCVKTGEITTIVSGTSFNIKYRDRNYSLYVDTGSVIVINDRKKQALRVFEGEFVTASDKEGFREVSEGRRELHLMWMKGEIVFERMKLIEVLKELQNYYDFDFVFVRADLAGREISGKFKRDTPIDKILKAVAFSVGADIEIVSIKERNDNYLKLLVKIK